MKKYFPFSLLLTIISLIGFSACIPIKTNEPVQSPAENTPAHEASAAPLTSEIPAKGYTPSPPVLRPTNTPQAVLTDRENVIKNCEELLAAFDQMLKTTGWIRTVHTNVYYDNRQGKYWDPEIREEWYRFDGDSRLVEGYNWTSTTDGVILQEAIYQGGIFYNLTFGNSSHGYNDQVDFTEGFLDRLKRGDKIAQAEVVYHGAKTWQFTSDINDGIFRTVKALYIDQESGLISGLETSVVQPDGSLMLVSGVVAQKFEIDADPPLQRFQELLEKAQRMH